MKIQAHLLKLLLVSSVCLIHAAFCLVRAETNSANSLTQAEPAGIPVSIPDISDLREKLDAVQRSNIETAEKWDALAKHNSALSNVLADLQRTLVVQRERELELGKQANSLHLKVIMGSAAAVLFVIILSYWFQMRCFSRVMELSRALPGVQPESPALLEASNPSTSKLLGAMKLLEHRIHQLEVPTATQRSSSNGVTAETIPAHTHTTSSGPSMFTDTAESTAIASNVTLLLAKGQVLLDTERLPEAASCFSEALELDPENAEAHLKKGVALERMNRLEQSLSEYEEALRLNPNRAVAYVYKARVLAGLHRYDEALSVYDSALGKNAIRTGSTTLAT